MDHPNLSPQLNAQLAQSEKDGGLNWNEVPDGLSVQVETSSGSTYLLSKMNGKTYVRGGRGKFQAPTPVEIVLHGSTWGGSMLKIDFIGIGMRMEFHVVGPLSHGDILTSTVKTITFQGVTE